MPVTYKYDIMLKSGVRAEVPEGAHLEDWGVVLKVVIPCVCSCGDRHKASVAEWRRDEIASATVSADGLTSLIV